MVKIALKVSCTLDKISEISTSGPDFTWGLKIKCSKCNEVDQNWHTVSLPEKVPSFKGPGSFNFQMKCKFCSTVSALDIIEDSIKRLVSGDNDSINKQTVVVFDCRGLEPVEFESKDTWVAKCEETGSEFTDVEFGDDGMWEDYDNKGKFPVSIYDFKGEFQRV